MVDVPLWAFLLTPDEFIDAEKLLAIVIVVPANCSDDDLQAVLAQWLPYARVTAPPDE